MEADLAFRGHDLRDLYRPGGGSSRLTLRRLNVLVRHLPTESHSAVAEGGDGYSTLELLVMEAGLFGPVNPRHPALVAEQTEAKAKGARAKDRAAHYAAVRARQESAASSDLDTLGDKTNSPKS